MKVIKEFFKNLSGIIKELKKTPRGKAILFFSFYFVFFIFVFIVLSVVGNVDTDMTEVDDSLKFSVASLERGNYNYSYSINNNGVIHLYEGISDGDEELFTYNLDNYYYGEFFMKSVSGTYVLDNNFDFLFSNIINKDNLIKIFENATYVSKTEYESGRVDYSYLISTTTLVKLCDDIDIDIEDVGNSIKISIDEFGNIVGINLDISSYSTYMGLGNTLIDLSYSNFGIIEEIEI